MDEQQRPVLIERTPKAIKRQQEIAGLVALGSFVLVFFWWQAGLAGIAVASLWLLGLKHQAWRETG